METKALRRVDSLSSDVDDMSSASPDLLLEDGVVQRLCEALSALHDGVEESILKELSNRTHDG